MKTQPDFNPLEFPHSGICQTLSGELHRLFGSQWTRQFNEPNEVVAA